MAICVEIEALITTYQWEEVWANFYTLGADDVWSWPACQWHQLLPPGYHCCPGSSQWKPYAKQQAPMVSTINQAKEMIQTRVCLMFKKNKQLSALIQAQSWFAWICIMKVITSAINSSCLITWKFQAIFGFDKVVEVYL